MKKNNENIIFTENTQERDNLDLNQNNSSSAQDKIDSRPKKRRKRPILWVLDVSIVVLVVLGLYFLIKPFYVARQQDKVMDELRNMLQTQSHNNETTGSASDSNTSTSTETEAEQSNENDNETILTTGETLPGIYVDSSANPVEGEQIERFTVDGSGYERSVVDAKEYDLPDEVLLQPIGRILINSIGVDLPLIVGAQVVPLRYGAGWYESSAMVGDRGRATILGHATTYSKRFFTRLPDVKTGDIVEIVQPGRTLIYEVYQKEFIPDAQLGSYLINNNTESELMLVTCYPNPTWEQRVLIFARLQDVRAN